MAALFSGWGADPFSELVDKATSELLPAGQEDIALNLEVCDQVRAKQVPPKQAMQVLRKRMGNKNPNVVLLTLGLTDICIKNGGNHFLAEVASREFMDNLTSILRNPAGVNNDVKNKALALIQNWSQIAETKPQQMGYISETYKSLSSSGFEFPPKDASNLVSAALVETMTAPEWTDSDVCMRCRTAFSTFNRKHHCRNCGNVFDQDCSGKTMALPWFGIGQDVRVCDSCFAKREPTSKTVSLARSKSAAQLPTGRGGAGSGSASGSGLGTGWHQRSRTIGPSTKRGPTKSSKEDDDLAMAIKLSLEASSSSGSRPGFVEAQVKEGRPTRQADGRMLEGTDADDDPDLAAAIAASLRDYATPAPSAPDGLDDGRATPRPGQQTYLQTESRLPLPPSLELPASDVDALLSFSHSTSMQEAYARQHGQWQPPHQQYQTQELYEKATAARPRMARSLDEATRRHGVLVSMHDKLSEAVRLYDRLLDAQMSRPTMYNAPYYNSAPFPTQGGYQERPPTMYPSMPMQGNPVYESEQHHPMTSPELAYSAMESPYTQQQQSSHYYPIQPAAYSMNPSSSREEVMQSPYSRHAPGLQQAFSQSPSAPPPALSSASSVSNQAIGSSDIHNRWQTLESLPSVPLHTANHTGSNSWSLNPPSQSSGSIYGNLPNLPQFEALPAHEQQQSEHRPQQHQSAEDNHAGWRENEVKKSSTRLGGNDDSLVSSPHTIASPYSAPPWTRPVETPLIDL